MIRRDTRDALLYIGPSIAVLLVIAAIPLGTALFTSATDWHLHRPAMRQFTGAANYIRLLGDERFTSSVGITAALTVMLGVPAAYRLSRFRIRFKKTIMLMILSVRFAPYIIFALPLFLIMSQAGFIGYRPALVFVYIILNLPAVMHKP